MDKNRTPVNLPPPVFIAHLGINVDIHFHAPWHDSRISSVIPATAKSEPLLRNSSECRDIGDPSPPAKAADRPAADAGHLRDRSEEAFVQRIVHLLIHGARRFAFYASSALHSTSL